MSKIIRVEEDILRHQIERGDDYMKASLVIACWYVGVKPPDYICTESVMEKANSILGHVTEAMEGEKQEGAMGKYVEVMLPSEVRIGDWWSWGYYQSASEAIKKLREAGIPVDDEGRLQLLNFYDDEEGIWDEEDFGEAYELAQDIAGDESDGVFHAIWHELEEE